MADRQEYCRLKAIRQQMIGRCHDPEHKDYYLYGARGIEVCQRWRDSLKAFLEDMGERPEKTTLDRVDNSKGYSKDNCRWISQAENNRNKRSNIWITADGRTQILTDWARELGCDVSNLRKRWLKYGKLNLRSSGVDW